VQGDGFEEDCGIWGDSERLRVVGESLGVVGCFEQVDYWGVEAESFELWFVLVGYFVLKNGACDLEWCRTRHFFSVWLSK
jgi:hypothetical protein